MDKLTTLIFDIVITVIIAFISVLIYFGLRSETVISTMDAEITENFLSEIKEKGSMKNTDYENYMYKLSLTGVLYEVLFEHRFHVLEPEYRMRTIEEIIAAQKAAYTGENIYHYKDVLTQIPIVTDPIDNSGLTMNTETNESILAAAINTPSSGHVHTDDCYLGHKHKGDKTFTHTHVHSSSCVKFLQSARYQVKCNSCGVSYVWPVVYKYWSPTNGETIGSWIGDAGLKNCQSCNSTYVTSGSQIDEPGYSCYYGIDLNHDGWDDEVPNGVSVNYTGLTVPQYAGTTVSGCYTYHKATSYTSRFRSGYSISDEALDYLANTVTGYCDVPEYYSATYHPSDSTLTSMTYRAEVQPDGQVLYVFASWRDYQVSSYGMTNNPGFPSPVTKSRLWDILRSDYQNTFRAATGHSGSSSYDDMTYFIGGSVSTCSYNHALGVNQLLTTCGQIENATLVCPDKVISIVPTNATQSVYTNEALITTVKATYQDGSTRIVLASTTFTTGTPVFNKVVTLSYTDTLGSTKTGTITVNVVPRNKVCSNGHTYNLNTDGSDPGCVFCHAYVGNIRIIEPSVSTITITIGSTLHDNGVKLLATYQDGHTETLTEGYEDNLDKQYLGTKMVKIGYKGATTQILVTTVCAKLTCDICGFLYELYPDGTNPGCPRCISKTPVFTGNVLHYDSINYTEDILETLYKNGIYRFNKDDMLAVTVKNKSSSLVRNLLRKIFPNMTEQWLHLESSETIQSK